MHGVNYKNTSHEGYLLRQLSITVEDAFWFWALQDVGHTKSLFER